MRFPREGSPLGNGRIMRFPREEHPWEMADHEVSQGRVSLGDGELMRFARKGLPSDPPDLVEEVSILVDGFFGAQDDHGGLVPGLSQGVSQGPEVV